MGGELEDRWLSESYSGYAQIRGTAWVIKDLKRVGKDSAKLYRSRRKPIRVAKKAAKEFNKEQLMIVNIV